MGRACVHASLVQGYESAHRRRRQCRRCASRRGDPTSDERFGFAILLRWNQDAPGNERFCEEAAVERDVVEVDGTGGVKGEVFAHDGQCAMVRTSSEYDTRVGGHF